MSEREISVLSKLKGSKQARKKPDLRSDKGILKAMTGNEAIAYAVEQIDYGVVAAFPITPSTELAHNIPRASADGKINTDFIPVESEHSAISAIQAAAAAGTRVFTATSSAGLALMHEMLHYYAGSRLPGVIAVVNRSIGAPLNILCDHSTIMAQRDTGWLQVFATTVQEAYHYHILAPCWSEACSLPIMVNIDGFELSHITERLEVLPTNTVRDFIGEWEPKFPLATDDDLTVVYPGIAGSDYYSEIKESQMAGMRKAEKLFEEVSSKLALVTGTNLNMVEGYKLDDAELVLVALGSASGTIRDKVSDMRSRGMKAGLLVVKVFRPFPHEKIREALKGKQAVGVMERAPVLGSAAGPLMLEVLQTLYDLVEFQRPRVANFIYGLGGRHIGMETIGKALNILDIIRTSPLNAHNPRVYHLDVRDNQPDALLPVEHINSRYYQPVSKKSIDIRMFARGGEGIKTACKILATAVIETGRKHAQGFSVYGAERSGAPTQGYVRIGDDVINERSPIIYSDIDIFSNPGLFNAQAIEGLKEDGIILINTIRSPAEIRDEFSITGRRIFTIDAYGIAQEEIGNPRRTSIVMLAALIGITDELLHLQELQSNIDKLPFSVKIIAANKRAAERGFSEWQDEVEKEAVQQYLHKVEGGMR